MKCKNCQGSCIKKGCQNRRQTYYFRSCKKYQQKTYTYRLCTDQDEETIVKLNNIGVGINGIANFTGISKANVVNRIKKIALKIRKKEIIEERQEYEVDEMYTIIGNKKRACYITYALNRKTKKVIDFVTGSRTKENIEQLFEIFRYDGKAINVCPINL